MERETLKLGKYALAFIIGADYFSEDLEENEYNDILSKASSYSLIKDEITSSDYEDGGADHTVVFQRLSDKKYFSFYYTDWDLEHNFERDFVDSAEEVFPKTITVEIFE